MRSASERAVGSAHDVEPHGRQPVAPVSAAVGGAEPSEALLRRSEASASQRRARPASLQPRHGPLLLTCFLWLTSGAPSEGGRNGHRRRVR